MPEFGINSPDLKIDSTYRSYVYKSTHKLTQEFKNGELTEALLDCEPTDVFVVSDLSHNDPLNLNRYNSIFIYYHDDLRHVGFSFCPENKNAKASLIVHRFTLAHKSNDKYGIEIFDKLGRVVFNSSEKPLLIQDAVRLDSTPQVIKNYNHRVGILAQPRYTISSGSFGIYQMLHQCLKVGNNRTVSYLCTTESEIDGEYFTPSTPTKPSDDRYPSMIVVNLSNI